MSRIEQYRDIPEIFFSAKTGSKFCECNICTENLLQENITYMVEKAYEKNIFSGELEIIFEYSVCLECAQKISLSYSKESVEKINSFFFEILTNDSRNKYDKNAQTEEWISKCVVFGTDKEELSGYQISGLCQGDKMIFSELPIMLGNNAVEKIQELLSEETREIMDGLKELLMPPSVKNRVPVFI